MLFVAMSAALILPSLVGCRSADGSSPTQYVLAASLGSHRIQVLSDRPATIEVHDDHVLISFAHHLLRVEEGRVVLDDNETAGFPVTATQILIELADGRLRMSTDGREMWKRLSAIE